MNKRFKEVYENLEGVTEKDLMNKKFECLKTEVIYLEGLVENLMAQDIVTKHSKAQETAKQKKKVEDDKLSV